MQKLTNLFNLSKNTPRNAEYFYANNRLFYAFADSGEGLWIFDGEFSENFAVKFDTLGFHAIDQLAVVGTIFMGSIVDAGDPEGAQVAFAIAAITVGIA